MGVETHSIYNAVVESHVQNIHPYVKTVAEVLRSSDIDIVH